MRDGAEPQLAAPRRSRPRMTSGSRAREPLNNLTPSKPAAACPAHPCARLLRGCRQRRRPSRRPAQHRGPAAARRWCSRRCGCGRASGLRESPNRRRRRAPSSRHAPATACSRSTRCGALSRIAIMAVRVDEARHYVHAGGVDLAVASRGSRFRLHRHAGRSRRLGSSAMRLPSMTMSDRPDAAASPSPSITIAPRITSLR